MRRCNQVPIGDISEKWETDYKPRILTCQTVPLTLIAEIFGCSVTTVQDMMASEKFPFCVCRDGRYQKSYDVFPLRFVAWYEGRMS